MKLEKIKFSIVLVLFAITLGVSSLFKPSLNEIDAQTLANDIAGVGKVKSEKIIKDREENGIYLGQKDFENRAKSLGIGEVVIGRISRKYKF